MKKLFIFILLFINYCLSDGLENNYSIQSDISFYLKTNHNNNILLSTDKNFFISDNELKLIDCDIKQFIPEFDPFKHEGLKLFQKTPTNLLFIEKPASLNLSKWDKVNKTRFSIVTASLVVGGIYAHNVQMRSWWSHDRGPFHLREDWEYACQLDKIGHGYTAMVISRSVTEMYAYSGVERGTSLLIGSLCAFGWQTYIEIMDGFGIRWGFDPTDYLGDLIGVIYPIAQEYYKPLRNFNLKMSYYPTPFLTTGVEQHGEMVKKGNFTEDYSGQMFWLSVNIYEYLPKVLQRYYPQWLAIAVGYGLSNWDGYMESHGHRVTDRELWLSFDYNLEKLPGDAAFLKLLKKLLNQFHLPAPAVRLTPSVVWYGLFYAHIL
jgi:hypothetical protein